MQAAGAGVDELIVIATVPAMRTDHQVPVQVHCHSREHRVRSGIAYNTSSITMVYMLYW